MTGETLVLCHQKLRTAGGPLRHLRREDGPYMQQAMTATAREAQAAVLGQKRALAVWATGRPGAIGMLALLAQRMTLSL